MSRENLAKAKKAKNDEFYTQYVDIQKEVESYIEYNPDTFRNKIVYCNCDDPYESNFFRYFVLNFKRLGLKKLITTSYKPSPVANTLLELVAGGGNSKVKSKNSLEVTANKIIINSVGDIDGDGEFSLKDIAQQLKENKNNEWEPLKEDGDFRSEECIKLLKKADIVVTNPPFSLFREYVAQLFEYGKQFLIIGNMNAITYKEVFPKIKENKMWLGVFSGAKKYLIPDGVNFKRSNIEVGEDGKRYAKMGNTVWFTNLDHGRRHQPLNLMTMEENKKFNSKVKKSKTIYKKYDNYNAIEVPFTDVIPSDHEGVMGVPISFLDKYNPDQFEIIKFRHGADGKDLAINGKTPYFRILIKHKKKK